MTDDTVHQEIEARLADYYRLLTPDDSLLVSNAAARQIAAVRAAAPVSGRVRVGRVLALTPSFGLAALGVAAIALAIVASALRPFSGPAAPTPTPDTDTPPPGEADAAVLTAGLIRSGGFWAIRDNLLLVTTDWGATWQASELPAASPLHDDQPEVVMLDANRAWLLESVSATEGQAGAATVSLAVERTIDGGKSWQRTSLPGQFTGTSSIAFVDAEHGSVTAVNSDTPHATVFRTDDGGATWQTMADAASTTAGPVGRRVTMSDANTLWAGAGFGGPSGQAMLAVSRDGGKTWAAVPLPNAPATWDGAFNLVPPIAPTFFDADNGVFAMVTMATSGQSINPQVTLYATSDAGHSWRIAGTHYAFSAVLSVPTSRDWILVDPYDFGLSPTGEYWRTPRLSGYLSRHPFVHAEFADAAHGFGFNAVGMAGAYPLYLTSDGGATWTPAQFGQALAVPSAPPSADEAAVRGLVDDFEVARSKAIWASAWADLSPWSQQQFGSIEAFQTWQEALNARGWSQYEVTTVLNGTSNWETFEPDLVGDVRANGDLDRAYAVVVFHAQLNGTADAKEGLVVAPSKGGGWKIWVTPNAPGATTTPAGGS